MQQLESNVAAKAVESCSSPAVALGVGSSNV